MATTNIPSRHAGRAQQSSAQLFRVGGSGFTVFHWEGKAIGFAQSVAHQSPGPVANPVAIQPLDSPYPLQIITPAAIGPGTLQIGLYEMYNQKIWDQIMSIIDASHTTGIVNNKLPYYNDLREVFVRMANIGKGISCTKVIFPPNKAGQTSQFYADTYLNCVITDIRDDEQIDIGSMEQVKNMTIQYTQSIRSRGNA